MHNVLLHGTLRWPMEMFDITPLGRIVNRFSKDVDTIDNTLPLNLRVVILQLFAVIIPKKKVYVRYKSPSPILRCIWVLSTALLCRLSKLFRMFCPRFCLENQFKLKRKKKQYIYNLTFQLPRTSFALSRWPSDASSAPRCCTRRSCHMYSDGPWNCSIPRPSAALSIASQRTSIPSTMSCRCFGAWSSVKRLR